MTLDAAGWQALIIREVGDIAPTGELLPADTAGILAENAAALWDAASAGAANDLRLQALAFKLRCLNTVIGQLSDLVPETAEGVTIQRQARVRTLQLERDSVLKQLADTPAALTVLTGQLVTTGPITAPWFPLPPSVPPDANSPEWTGSPYFPLRRFSRRIR